MTKAHDKSSVFISRSLKDQSCLKRYFEENSISYIAQSLIVFNKREISKLDSTWIFFYSKTAVSYFFNQNKMSQYKFIKIACFGEATSQFLEEETGRKVDYIGNSNAKQVSNDLSLVVGDELITFIIGNNSLRSVQKEIKSSSKLEERIIYKNEAVENVKP